MVDIFLTVNLSRDKKWARDWTIVRLILGMILWSLLNYASGGWIGVVTTVLLVVPLLLVLLGRPRTWRTVIGALWFLLVFLVLLNLMLLGLLRANLSDMPPITLSKMQEAEAALQEGDYVVAIRLYGEVTRSEPDNVNARYGLCRAYLTSENPSTRSILVIRQWRWRPSPRKSGLTRRWCCSTWTGMTRPWRVLRSR